MTEPLFAFFSHIEQLPPTTDEDRLSPLPASRERAALDSSFNDLIAKLDEQRQEAARHEQLYRTIVECSSELMFWISADHTTIHYISPNCRDLTGYEPNDFYTDATLLDRIIHPDFRQRWQDRLTSTWPGPYTWQVPH